MSAIEAPSSSLMEKISQPAKESFNSDHSKTNIPNVTEGLEENEAQNVPLKKFSVGKERKEIVLKKVIRNEAWTRRRNFLKKIQEWKSEVMAVKMDPKEKEELMMEINGFRLSMLNLFFNFNWKDNGESNIYLEYEGRILAKDLSSKIIENLKVKWFEAVFRIHSLVESPEKRKKYVKWSEIQSGWHEIVISLYENFNQNPDIPKIKMGKLEDTVKQIEIPSKTSFVNCMRPSFRKTKIYSKYTRFGSISNENIEDDLVRHDYDFISSGADSHENGEEKFFLGKYFCQRSWP